MFLMRRPAAGQTARGAPLKSLIALRTEISAAGIAEAGRSLLALDFVVEDVDAELLNVSD